jgi:Sec-independent protein secretion pathway component TatC
MVRVTAFVYFLCCGETAFLLGFLRKCRVTCGVFVVSLWCYAWLKMVVIGQFFTPENAPTFGTLFLWGEQVVLYSRVKASVRL